MRHRSKAQCVILFLCTVWIEVAQGSPAESLSEQLASIDTLSADFFQITRDGNGRVLQENEGQLQFTSPSRFRIETSSPFAQTLVSDGVSFWSYDVELEQVVIQDLDQNIKQVPILLLGNETDAIIREFDVSHFADEDGDHYVLTPRSPDGLFESLAIFFKEQVPASFSILDSLGQQTRIDLSNVIANGEIDSQQFTFNIPSSVDVIDDRLSSQ